MVLSSCAGGDRGDAFLTIASNSCSCEEKLQYAFDGLSAHGAALLELLQVFSTCQAAAHMCRRAVHQRRVCRVLHTDDARELIGVGTRIERCQGSVRAVGSEGGA